jgi:hypothetical protein
MTCRIQAQNFIIRLNRHKPLCLIAVEMFPGLLSFWTCLVMAGDEFHRLGPHLEQLCLSPGGARSLDKVCSGVWGWFLILLAVIWG